MYFTESDRKKDIAKKKARLKELDNTPIDVRSDITPISYEKIHELRSDLWQEPKASMDFLHSQMQILQQRKNAIGIDQPQMLLMIDQGINALNYIINKRSE